VNRVANVLVAHKLTGFDAGHHQPEIQELIRSQGVSAAFVSNTDGTKSNSSNCRTSHGPHAAESHSTRQSATSADGAMCGELQVTTCPGRSYPNVDDSAIHLRQHFVLLPGGPLSRLVAILVQLYRQLRAIAAICYCLCLQYPDSDMKSTILTAITLFCAAGCATSLVQQSVLEDRVISQFVEAIDEENEHALRRVSSTPFESKALRSDDVLNDLELADLPSGDLEIVDVDEMTKVQRAVEVKDSNGKNFKFRLVRDEEKQRWTVDDVLIRQEKKSRKSRSNIATIRPATELLDLVFTVREFLDAWSQADRDGILARSSPALASSMESVPESWLGVISARIADSYDGDAARKPEAQLTTSSAVVRMPVRGGHLLVSAVSRDNKWLIDDIEIHQRSTEGHTGSVRRQADAVGGLSNFLTAFEGNSATGLRDWSTESFFKETIQFADLKLVDLPSAHEAPDEFNIRAFSGRVTIMVPTERDIIRFDMVDPDLAERELVARSTEDRRFVVDNVILYDRGRRNERTLGSVFTAPVRVALFVKALRDREVPVLRQLSSLKFNEQVWTRVDPTQLSSYTLPSNQLAELELIDSTVHGVRTELKYRDRDGATVNCLLTEDSGKLLVDDIHYTNSEQQMLSLKTQMSLQVPIIAFTHAWQSKDLPALRETCSARFNRLALTQLNEFPADVSHLGSRLDSVVTSTHITDLRATVQLGLASRPSAQIKLVNEHDKWVVNDINIPTSPTQTVQLQNELRSIVASDILSRQHQPVASSGSAPPGREPTGMARQPIAARVPRPIGTTRQVAATADEVSADSDIKQAVHMAFGPDAARILQERNAERPTSAAETPHDLALATIDDTLRPVPSAAQSSTQQSTQPPVAVDSTTSRKRPSLLNLADRPVPIQ